MTELFPDAMGLLLKSREETYAKGRKNLRFLRARTYKEYLETEEALDKLTSAEARELGDFRRAVTISR